MPILFVSNNNFSPGLSGGDRIFIELLRRWSKRQSCGLMGAQETNKLITDYHLKNIDFHQTDTFNHRTIPTVFNVIFHQFRRTIKASLHVILHHQLYSQYSTIYAVSDFFPDLIPALILKKIYPNSTLICGFYLIIPHPKDPTTPYTQTSQPLKNYFYHYGQKLSLWLVNKFANIVYVTSEPDISRFPNKKVVVIKGGVDIKPASKWLSKNQLTPYSQRRYTGCFMGRFHPQKGVLILIDIWKLVVNKIPHAKLALIGDGQLKPDVIKKIKNHQLENNIDLFGFLDGQPKEKIFRSSAIILHPATFDSGGMAAAEAMSWGLPGVSFDLEALKTYYPKGMIKIAPNDIQSFANTIIKLIKNPQLYKSTSKDALNLTREFWDWDKRAETIYDQTFL